MRVPDYTSLGTIEGHGFSADQCAELARIQQADADECLAEIALVDPGYHAELVEAQYEPCSPFDEGRLVRFTEDEGDEEFEPCAHAYANELCPGIDGVLPGIFENAIYYRPSPAESKRAKRNRTYGITEGDDGIYSILFDSSGRPRGGVSGITKNRRTKAEVEAARKVEAKAKRKEERERAKLLARVAAQRA